MSKIQLFTLNFDPQDWMKHKTNLKFPTTSMSGNTLPFYCTFTKAFLTWGTTAFLLWQTTVLVGQTPSFVTSADVAEAIAGVPFELKFTLTDAEGQRFTPPSFRDFKLTGGVSEMRGMTFEKGKTRSSQAWAYTLEPLRAGTFTIDPASVSVAGRVLNTSPFTIKVLAAPPATGNIRVPPGNNDEVFIVSSLSKPKAFPGEQIVWRLVLFTRVAIEGADLISMPDFEGFYSKEKRHFDTRVQYQTIKGKKYAVKTLHEEAVFPQTAGKLTIGAAQIRVGIDQPGNQGFLFGPKPVTLTSQAISLNVMPLREPVPETFSGAVGHYEWEVHPDTTHLTTDDALLLTVTIRGNGDSRRFAAPKITVPASCEIFEPRVLEDVENETESEIVHKKKLEYVVLPKEPGFQEIVPQLTYFDLDSNRYCTISVAPIRFEVTAGVNYKPFTANDTIPLPLKTVVQVGIWEKAADFIGSPYFLWSIMLLLAICLVLYIRGRKPRNTPQPVISKKEKTSAAHERFVRIGNLLNQTAPETFYNELLKSLQGYIALRLDLSPAQLNQSALRTKLTERKVTPIRVQAFLSILQTCEQAVFSGHTDPSKMESDWHAAEVIVQALEKEIR